jgi:hypothetical protein
MIVGAASEPRGLKWLLKHCEKEDILKRDFFIS